MTGPSAENATSDTPKVDTSTKQIRGSALLLAGRGVSLLLNFVTQVITIRYLIKADYGAFAYAISLIELASLTAAFGMDKTFSQFGAIYHEQGNLRRLNGALIFSTSVILGLGFLLAGGYWISHDHLSQWMSLDGNVQSLLFLMVLLIPAGAFGSLACSFFAVLGETGTVFYRRHLIGPGVKCLALITAILLNGGLQAVALSFICAGVVQFLLDLFLMVKFCRKYRLIENLKQERPDIPAREFLGFSLPLLISDGTTMIRGALVVVILGMVSGSLAAASFRAVLPVIKLSELPLITFGILFTPLASRLMTRNQQSELQEMYVRSRTWVRVLTFPIFAVCVLLAEPVIQILFGSDYLDSVPVMVILAIGFYFQAALGFNSRLLKVLGKMRLVVLIDAVGTLVTLGLCLVMIPRGSFVGASFAVSLGIVFHTLLREAVIQRVYPLNTQINGWNSSSVSTFAAVAGVILVRLWLTPTVLLGILWAVAFSLTVFLVNRPQLQVESMFPEVRRFPMLRRFFTGVSS